MIFGPFPAVCFHLSELWQSIRMPDFIRLLPAATILLAFVLIVATFGDLGAGPTHAEKPQVTITKARRIRKITVDRGFTGIDIGMPSKA